MKITLRPEEGFQAPTETRETLVWNRSNFLGRALYRFFRASPDRHILSSKHPLHSCSFHSPTGTPSRLFRHPPRPAGYPNHPVRHQNPSSFDGPPTPPRQNLITVESLAIVGHRQGSDFFWLCCPSRLVLDGHKQAHNALSARNPISFRGHLGRSR